MKSIPVAPLVLATFLMLQIVHAKKPSRPVPIKSTKRRPGPSVGSDGGSGSSSRRPPVSRRRVDVDDDRDDADPFEPIVEEELDEEVMEDEEDVQVAKPITRSKRSPSDRMPPQRTSRAAPATSRKDRIDTPARKRPPVSSYVDEEDEVEDEEDDFVPPRRDRGRPPPRTFQTNGRRGPPPRQANDRGGNYNNSRRPGGARGVGGGGGRVVPYSRPGHGAADVLTKGWSAVVSVLPDPEKVKEAALSGISAAKQTTSNLSANIYREVKGLTSSELEQVMLKATRPDDTAVKGKHVERLVGVTYQISSRYDIYDAVLRKLWSKMVEKDWRTTVKALYILHRFSADGSPEHAPALKARLRELRRTRDPKRKDKYFNSKQLLAGDASPENIKFRAFMSRYAHYVLLRAQCFGGMFDEIASLPPPDKKKGAIKPITSTCLRAENYNAAEMLLKAGVVCILKDGEECENTAIACERVASDMIGLTSAVAVALNRALKDDNTLKGADVALLKKWILFYKDELLPQTKSMVKRISPKLDVYGLFLPSRMGTSVAPGVLEKGLNLEEQVDDEENVETKSSTDDNDAKHAAESEPTVPAATVSEAPTKTEIVQQAPPDGTSSAPKETTKVPEKTVAGTIVEEAEEDDEYEYEEDEYYDDDEEA